MPKLTIVMKKFFDEFNEDLSIIIDNVQVDKSNVISLESGEHILYVQQQHMYNNKFFLLLPLLVIFGFIAASKESAYLFRRWGKFATLECKINVGENDEEISIDLQRKRLGLFLDSYSIGVTNEMSHSKSIEVRNVRTILGTIMFFMYISIFVVLLVYLFK